jgi:hypothetical protein
MKKTIFFIWTIVLLSCGNSIYSQTKKIILTQIPQQVPANKVWRLKPAQDVLCELSFRFSNDNNSLCAAALQSVPSVISGIAEGDVPNIKTTNLYLIDWKKEPYTNDYTWRITLSSFSELILLPGSKVFLTNCLQTLTVYEYTVTPNELEKLKVQKQKKLENETNNPIVKSDQKSTNSYTIEKYTGNSTPILTDTTFTVDQKEYKVSVLNYAKGQYNIADTSGKIITLYREDFIDIEINDKVLTISKPMFNKVYNKNTLYHSGFGTAYIEKIDRINKKIIFKTFFGYHQSDEGVNLIYSVSFDGKYEFIKSEVPSSEEGE